MFQINLEHLARRVLYSLLGDMNESFRMCGTHGTSGEPPWSRPSQLCLCILHQRPDSPNTHTHTHTHTHTQPILPLTPNTPKRKKKNASPCGRRFSFFFLGCSE